MAIGKADSLPEESFRRFSGDHRPSKKQMNASSGKTR